MYFHRKKVLYLYTFEHLKCRIFYKIDLDIGVINIV